MCIVLERKLDLYVYAFLTRFLFHEARVIHCLCFSFLLEPNSSMIFNVLLFSFSYHEIKRFLRSSGRGVAIPGAGAMSGPKESNLGLKMSRFPLDD